MNGRSRTAIIHSERKAITRRRFMATTLALTSTAGVAALTGGLLGFGTPPTYLKAPTVQAPFTAADPDTQPDAPETPPVMRPMEVAIPSLEIHAGLIEVGLEPGTNKMEIPSPEKIGYYTPAAPIGAATGSTLLAGHVNNGLSPGALWNLAKAQKGAHVYITNSTGQQFTYKITTARTIQRQPLPEDTYTLDGTPQLVIITCAGEPAPDGKVLNYTQNTIITAVPA
ncbi:sortase (surface protein transpeptidase) [Paenarthrobacter histidinolovorans]|uniref:Sortase (Surface protein transpeptidase) n=2 Tax=Paenarthrobacter histidinolovorans TaxID=43664 RepID=A0ABW8MZH8_9MICC